MKKLMIFLISSCFTLNLYGAEKIIGVVGKYVDQEQTPKQIQVKPKAEAEATVEIIPSAPTRPLPPLKKQMVMRPIGQTRGTGKHIDKGWTSKRFTKQVQVGHNAEATAGGNLISPEVLATLPEVVAELQEKSKIPNPLAQIKGDPQEIAVRSVAQALNNALNITQTFNMENLTPRLQKIEELRQRNPALDSYYSEYRQALIGLALNATKQIKLNELEKILDKLSEKNISDISDDNQLKLLRSIREIIEGPIQRTNPEKIKEDFINAAQRFDQAGLALKEAGGTIPK
jgi:hypothetical protein